jgi:hypothetical protein
MYIGRKLEKREKLELRKEMWSSKLMRIASAENSGLKLSKKMLTSPVLWDSLEKAIDSNVYNDKAKREVEEALVEEERLRKEHVKKIQALEDDMDHAVGRTEFAKQIREKRRKKKKALFESNHGGRAVAEKMEEARFVELEIRGRDFLDMDDHNKSDP